MIQHHDFSGRHGCSKCTMSAEYVAACRIVGCPGSYAAARDIVQKLENLEAYSSSVEGLRLSVPEPAESPDHDWFWGEMTARIFGHMGSDIISEQPAPTVSPPMPEFDHEKPFPLQAMKPANMNLRLGARPYIPVDD